MLQFLLIAGVLVLSAWAFMAGKRRAFRVAGSGDGGSLAKGSLAALPVHYGTYVALWCGLPALALFAAWSIASPWIADGVIANALPAEIQQEQAGRIELVLGEVRRAAASGVLRDEALRPAVDAYTGFRQTSLVLKILAVLVVALGGLSWAYRRVAPTLKARDASERIVHYMIMAASTIAILTTVGIVLSLLFETVRFFGQVSLGEFLFGLQWSPQTALRADQVGSSGAFGAVPVFAGTALITVLAMLVAVPVGLMSAIYMAEYASPRVRAVVKPLTEVLAGIPTVVYGFFAALTIGPLVRDAGEALGLSVASESALAAGLVMGIMIIPFISSLSDDVINAVPQSLRDGAYAMGSTKSETIIRVVLPAALHGIVGAVLLAVSRAIGETMIVVMAAGLAANLTANPFEAVTTVTVQIATLLVGDQEFDSAKTLSAFALGMTLFLVTLCLNVIALHVVRKYREAYD